MGEVIIEFQNVTKIYKLIQNVSYKELLFSVFSKEKRKNIKKEFIALKNISFSVKRGETVGIIGRNGAGKSTLLSLLAGVIKPTSGKIIVKDRVSPLLELGSGFHPELNAYENIRLNGVLLGIPLKFIKNKVDDIIKFAELEEFADQPIRTYSSGMLARLGFSVVTQLNPKILLIDEVLAVGDERFRRKCIDLMLSFKKRNITMLFVSHNLHEVELLCDRVIWIENHEIKMDGATAEVIEKFREVMS